MNLIVFDIDGTLLNTTDVDSECYQEALKDSFDIDISGFDWENYTDVTDQGVTEDILKEHFKRLPMPSEMKKVEEKMCDLVASKALNEPHKFLPADGIKNVLKQLLSQNEVGYTFATGAWKASAEAKLSALKMDLSSVPWEHSGPIRRRADIVLSAIEKAKMKFGVESFEDICALGDGKWDLLTAQELGINFVGVDLLKTGRLKELGSNENINQYSDKQHIESICFQ